MAEKHGVKVWSNSKDYDHTKHLYSLIKVFQSVAPNKYREVQGDGQIQGCWAMWLHVLTVDMSKTVDGESTNFLTVWVHFQGKANMSFSFQ